MISWTNGDTYNTTSIEQSFGFVYKFLSSNDVIHSFLSSKSKSKSKGKGKGKGKQWLDAIYSQLQVALPIMELLISITRESEDDKYYTTFLGVDALIHENVEVVLLR